MLSKKILFFALLLGWAGLSKAQEFYLDVQVGYALGYPGQEYYAGAQDFRVDADSNITTQGIYGTFGEGLHANLGVGTFLGEHVGIEIDGHLVMGGWQVWNAYNDEIRDVHEELRSKTWQVRLVPSIVLRSRSEGNFLYIRSGLPIALAGRSMEEYSFSDPNGVTYSIESTENIDYRISLGFSGALGMNFELSEALDLLFEIEGVTMRVKQKQGEYTHYMINNSDFLDGRETFFVEKDYVDEITDESNTLSNPNLDLNAPEEVLSLPINFSSIGAKIGLRFNF